MASKNDIKELKLAIKGLQTSVDSMHADLLHVKDSVIKALQDENSKLKTRLRSLEVEFMNNSNHQRRSNLVITGIPADVVSGELESVVIKIMSVVDVAVCDQQINAVHRLGKIEDKRGGKRVIRYRMSDDHKSNK